MLPKDLLDNPSALAAHTARIVRQRQEFAANYHANLAHQSSALADAADAADVADDDRHTHHLRAAYENRCAQTLCEELGWMERATDHGAKVERHGTAFHALGGHGRKTKVVG